MSDSPSSKQNSYELAGAAFREMFGREPSADRGESCWIAGYVSALERSPVETSDDLAHIVGDIHEAVGEDRDSDHATLPVRIRQLLADLRNEICALETPQRNVYTAVDYVGIGPLPNCDLCKQPYAAHDQTTYYCPQ